MHLLPSTLQATANAGRICIYWEQLAWPIGVIKSTIWLWVREEDLPDRILSGQIIYFVVSAVNTWLARRYGSVSGQGRGTAAEHPSLRLEAVQDGLPPGDQKNKEVAYALGVSMRTLFQLRESDGLPMTYQAYGKPYVRRSLDRKSSRSGGLHAEPSSEKQKRVFRL